MWGEPVPYGQPDRRRRPRTAGVLAPALATLAAAAAVAALAAGSDTAHGAFSGARNGQIVFETGRDPIRSGNDQIFVVGPSGENPTNISNHGDNDGSPSFSADGRKIVFDGDPDIGNDELYVMDANGENRKRLTSTEKDESDPVFSPDGSTIAFTSFVNGSFAEVHLMDVSGGNERKLSAAPPQTSDSSPAWSPGGSRIAFVRDISARGGESLIYTVNTDGSGETQITPTDTTSDFDPDYSPDGSQIAFVSNRDGNDEIYVMNADGSNQRRLTSSPLAESNPAWSPDGSLIAFEQGPARSGGTITFGAGEILVMSTSGRILRNLTRDSGERDEEPGDEEPDWQPLGASADTTAPALVGGPIRVAPVFAIAPRQTPPRGVLTRSGAARGTAIRFRISEPASVKLAIERASRGIKRGTRCVASGARSAARRKRCTATKLVGWLVRRSGRGARSVPFSGRIGRKALTPGRYRIRAGAVDAGANPARHKSSRTFRIVRR